jgi:hypothetical protein
MVTQPTGIERTDLQQHDLSASGSVRNVGEGKASELATYVVEKGRPVVVVAE